MLKRKINAAVSLLTTAMLLTHAIVFSIFMLTRCRVADILWIMSWVLLGVMLIHALISIDIAISAHAETGERKGKSYPKMNVPTVVQRASGMLMLPAIILHVLDATGVIVPPQMVQAVVHPLFFAAALAHTAISTSKALITLGIGNAKLIKIVNVVMRVICGATLIAAVIGIYLRTFAGGAA